MVAELAATVCIRARNIRAQVVLVVLILGYLLFAWLDRGLGLHEIVVPLVGIAIIVVIHCGQVGLRWHALPTSERNVNGVIDFEACKIWAWGQRIVLEAGSSVSIAQLKNLYVILGRDVPAVVIGRWMFSTDDRWDTFCLLMRYRYPPEKPHPAQNEEESTESEDAEGGDKAES
jgi:hypothetical protein